MVTEPHNRDWFNGLRIGPQLFVAFYLEFLMDNWGLESLMWGFMMFSKGF